MSRGGRVAIYTGAAVLLVLWPRPAALLALLVLPGAWISYCPLFRDWETGERFWIGAALSPVVLVAQFWALRLLGLGFDATALTLAVINVPPILLVARSLPPITGPSPGNAALAFILLLIPVACLTPQLIDAPGRALSGHAWWHADAAYAIANGQLDVEDADMAGVRLGYAWAGHAYQAVLSRIANTPPNSSFIWTNLVCLSVIWVWMARIVGALGGGWRSRVMVAVWLSFGVNVVGYTITRSQVLGLLGPLAPTVSDLLPLGGDWRFTPWLLYFYFFHQIVIALMFFATMCWIMVRSDGFPRDVPSVVVLSLLGVGLGVIYPLLVPAATGLLGASMIASLGTLNGPRQQRWTAVSGAGAVLVLSMAAAGATTAYVARDRVAAMVALHSLSVAGRHLAIGTIALLPLLAGVLVSRGRAAERSATATSTLVLGGLASLAAYALVALPGGGLEYKFVFTAAICLAPFAALAGETALARLGRASSAGHVVLALVLAAPFVHKLVTDGWSRHWIPALVPAAERRLALDTETFDLRLQTSEPDAALADAIRGRTPRTTILVVRSATVHLPTVTQRPFWIAPPQKEGSFPGINVSIDEVLLDIRGYDASVVEQRRRVVSALYGADDAVRGQALGVIASLRRPVAIVTERADEDLARWLAAANIPRLWSDDNRAVWLEDRPLTSR